MNQPTPVPRQPDLLIVAGETHAAVLRLQERTARFLVKIPLGGSLAPDLLHRTLVQFARPYTYARIFAVGDGLDLGAQAIPIITLPWPAFREASKLLTSEEASI
jgi:hypothetical protein